jgi:hypothetical protein
MKTIRRPYLLNFEFATKNGKIMTGIGPIYYKKGDAIFKQVKGIRYNPIERFKEDYCILDSPEGEINVVAIYKNKENKIIMQILKKITENE